MKILSYFIIFLIIISCSNNKSTYWCGDHPCINKGEKKAYFKETMTIEIKYLKKEDLKNNSVIEKITQQVQIKEKSKNKNEKKLAKQAKLEKKQRIKEEKI